MILSEIYIISFIPNLKVYKRTNGDKKNPDNECYTICWFDLGIVLTLYNLIWFEYFNPIG
jgi:hypothetical protein